MAKLTARGRNRMAKSSFAIPSRKAYPINDLAHARNALARVAQHGTATEKKQVQAAVRRKYPSIAVGGKKTARKSSGGRRKK